LRELDDAVDPGLKELEELKKNLDKHLDTIRDDPEAPQSNSLLHALLKTPAELRHQRKLRKQLASKKTPTGQ
jgi:hypothetical protein